MFLSGFLLILGYIFLRPLRKFLKTTKINSSFQLISAMDCELVPLPKKNENESGTFPYFSYNDLDSRINDRLLDEKWNWVMETKNQNKNLCEK